MGDDGDNQALAMISQSLSPVTTHHITFPVREEAEGGGGGGGGEDVMSSNVTSSQPQLIALIIAH